MESYLLDKPTGLYYVDAISLAMCQHCRIKETIIGELKAICQIEHTRHRKPDNFLVNLIAGLMTYRLRPRKPAIPMQKNIN